MLSALILPAACETVPGPVAEVDVPAYETLAAAHNDRVDRIREVYARGVIELWWTDDDGRHHEQGDADLWVAPPARTALHVSKLGHRFMWIGSDDDRVWLFDFRQDPTTLHVADRGELSEVPFEPTLLLELGGLTRMPATGGQVRYDDERDAWAVTTPEGLILYLDRGALLPVAAQRADAEVLLYSRMKLSGYDRIDLVGHSPLDGARFPTVVDLGSTDGRMEVRLVVRAPTDDEVEARYFDLTWLRDRFCPCDQP